MVSENEKKWIDEFLEEKEIISQSLYDSTIKNYYFILFNFWGHYGDPSKLSEVEISKIIKKMRNENYSTKTIHTYVACLKSYISFLLDKRYIETNNLSRISKIIPKIESRTPIYLKKNEIIKIIEILKNINDKRKYHYIMLFYLPIVVGFRPSETSRCNLEDLDLKNGIIKIIGKGNKERFVPLPLYNEEFMEYLNKYLKEREEFLESKKILDESAFFVNQRGKRLSIRDVQRHTKKIINLAGIERKITPHKLRHTFASLLYTLDLRSIQKLLGHSKSTTTEIYVHVDFQQIKENMTDKQILKFGE